MSKFSSNDFKRIRVGIGVNSGIIIKDYVFFLFIKDEMIVVEEVFEKVVDVVIFLVYNDVNFVMNKFNIDNKKRVI